MRRVPVSIDRSSRPALRVARPRRGFTLLETILASVIGSFVLLACFSLFMSMSRVENSMNRASRQMEELAVTQQVFRKSFMTMALIGEQALESKVSELAVDGVVPEEERRNIPRPRLIVDFDEAPSIGGMVTSAMLDGVQLRDPAGFDAGPQFIEIVLPDKPVPESMRLFPAQWSTQPADDLTAAYGPSGFSRPENESGIRGIFELRPEGARERVMEGYGIVPATGLEPRPLTPAAREVAEGWTLWWRPMYGEEYWARQAGQVFDVDSRPALLEEAVPLIRGVKEMRVYAFAAEETPEGSDVPLIRQRWPSYEASTAAELPGYVEVEIQTTGGMTAAWVFEMGWSITDESSGTPADESATEGQTPGEDGSTEPQPGQQPGQQPAQQPNDPGRVGDRT